MRKSLAIFLAGILYTVPNLAVSAEIDLDSPLAPAEKKPVIKPDIKLPSPGKVDPSKDGAVRPKRPETNLDRPEGRSKDNAPALDPDAEQINRGELNQ
ncbi:hypothetical protein LG201_03195 [Methylobacillus gramineus]|uniref:hypothetical protein n=1 Tax=Methylobacillus gramineus TaxID=755169 RepID=UPI001CFFF8DE|nr:hypothetical protein [Methylobacillus gramineus]MCB5184204.1 hypothetical protein [Methylobacillus gramineus]